MSAVLSLNGKPQLVLPAADGAPDQSAAGAATQRVMGLLGAVLRVKISDGRVVVGKFHCFDKHQNIILTDTREYLPLHPTGAHQHNGGKKGSGKQSKQQQQPKAQDEEQEREEEEKELWKTGTSRSLGMALVPGKHIVYVKVERATTAAHHA